MKYWRTLENNRSQIVETTLDIYEELQKKLVVDTETLLRTPEFQDLLLGCFISSSRMSLPNLKAVMTVIHHCAQLSSHSFDHCQSTMVGLVLMKNMSSIRNNLHLSILLLQIWDLLYTQFESNAPKKLKT